MTKILIVDDDSFLLDMYAMKFTQAGFTVDTAASGEDALKKMRDGHTFDVVLLDMVMPQMTGLDLLRAIKGEKLSGSPACIVLSNQGEKADIDGAEALGVDGYIVKANMIPSEVVSTVKDIVAHKHT